MIRLYFAISLVSCSVLMFEVSLTRLFSIYLWYHFASMVISIAMLGIGSAGTVLSICSRNLYQHKKAVQKNSSGLINIPQRFYSDSTIGVYSALAGVSLITCYTVSNYIPFDPVKFSWERIQILYLALYCLILSIPFFFSGMLIATVFLIHSERSKIIYSSDLLGAGTGTLMVLVFLDIAGPS